MIQSLVRAATAADEARCLAVLALAFSGDPPCRWAWPDAQEYLEAFPRFARAFGGGAMEHGTAYYYEGFSGVALWLPPGTAPDEASLVRVIQDTVADARKKEAMFSRTIGKIKPSNTIPPQKIILISPSRRRRTESFPCSAALYPRERNRKRMTPSITTRTCSPPIKTFKAPESWEKKPVPKVERIIDIDPVESADTRKRRGSRLVFHKGTDFVAFRRIPV